MPRFFGEVDRDRDGKISSEIPSYAMPRHMQELKESIDRKVRELERGSIPPAQIPEMQAQISKERERYDKIASSKPRLTAKEKDDAAKAHKEIGEKIKDSMFTDYDMKKGLASAHEEAERMVTPIIPLTGEQLEIAKECGAKIVDGRVSRNDASRIYKILGANLGENTNVERLRRDRISREG